MMRRAGPCRSPAASPAAVWTRGRCAAGSEAAVALPGRPEPLGPRAAITGRGAAVARAAAALIEDACAQGLLGACGALCGGGGGTAGGGSTAWGVTAWGATAAG